MSLDDVGDCAGTKQAEITAATRDVIIRLINSRDVTQVAARPDVQIAGTPDDVIAQTDGVSKRLCISLE